MSFLLEGVNIQSPAYSAPAKRTIYPVLSMIKKKRRVCSHVPGQDMASFQLLLYPGTYTLVISDTQHNISTNPKVGFSVYFF